MIVQELFRLQREAGYLRKQSLLDISAATGVPLYRWHEVASFFPHFRLAPPAATEVHVCHDMACRLRGACDLEKAAKQVAAKAGDNKVAVHGVSCLGRCDRAPAAMIDEHLHVGSTAKEFAKLIEAYAEGSPPKHDYDADQSRQNADGWSIDPYDKSNSSDSTLAPYDSIRRFAEQKVLSAKDVISALETAGLLGMGGAGGRAYKKWDDVLRAEGDQKYVVCNADESEPGTFKDRELLLRTPWIVLEGMILGGLVTGADRGYVYIRHEYHEQIEAVQAAIDAARRIGACGSSLFGTSFRFELEVFVSPGGYICGEQTALIEAMQDHRGEPRNRPPQLQTNGLWNQPTLLSNVETFAWVPAIMARENGKWFAAAGRPGMQGRRFFSISGDVAKPGAYEVPNGITLGELIDDYAGGMRDGLKFKAVAPSGPSGGFLPAKLPTTALRRDFSSTLKTKADFFDLRDWTLDIATSRAMGLMLGAGIVVYAEGTDMVDQAWACSRFYRNESCGKCVPCRIGSQKLTEILGNILERNFDPKQLDSTKQLVDELGGVMAITSICGLGQVASAPIRTLLEYFQDDIVRHLKSS